MGKESGVPAATTLSTRCKPGDVAVVTWDFPGCLQNLGRLVHVRGPASIEDGLLNWHICPLDPAPYWLRETDNSVLCESVSWPSRVIHPDAWMEPIRPDASDGNAGTQRLEPCPDVSQEEVCGS